MPFYDGSVRLYRALQCRLPHFGTQSRALDLLSELKAKGGTSVPFKV